MQFSKVHLMLGMDQIVKPPYVKKNKKRPEQAEQVAEKQEVDNNEKKES